MECIDECVECTTKLVRTSPRRAEKFSKLSGNPEVNSRTRHECRVMNSVRQRVVPVRAYIDHDTNYQPEHKKLQKRGHCDLHTESCCELI